MTREYRDRKKINEREYLSSFYKLLESGKFELDEIEIAVVETSLKRTKEQQAFIDRKWDEFKEKNRKNVRPSDEEPSRFRYEGHEVIDGKLTIKVSPVVSYKDHVGCDEEYIKKYGIENSTLSFSTTTLIETSDGEIVVTIRGGDSDYKAGGTSLVGGFVKIDKDTREDGSVDIVGSTLREVKEESGIKPKEISNLTVVDIVFNPRSGTVDLGIVAITHLSSDEILKKTHDDENVIVVVDASDGEAFENFIFKFTHAHVGGALAVLVEYGSTKFGPKWRDGVIRLLRVKGSVYDKRNWAFEKMEEWNAKKIASNPFKLI